MYRRNRTESRWYTTAKSACIMSGWKARGRDETSRWSWDPEGGAMSAGVLILGGGGYLGGYFRAAYPEASAPQGDIADREWVKQVMGECRPAVVINCAGRTGKPNVDWCEAHKGQTLRG